MIMTKVFQIVSWFTIISALGLMVIFGYWWVKPYTPIKFNKMPFPIRENTVQSGGVLYYETDYCKYNELIPQVSKIFRDSILYNVPAQLVLAKKVGCADVFVGTEIPKALPLGHYTLQIIYKYQVNPIRSVEVVAETQPFDVVK